ncbi:MAG: hypothetical protein OXH78_06035 [Acidimicrobiaceae bacterium]|nr:hypothetical protein [Acidimicrobiaceae bacterium]
MPEDAVWVSAADRASVIDHALATLEQHAHRQTDGIWLEDLTAEVATHIRDWNIDGCWSWPHWPDREAVMPPGTPAVDVGIDLVARRRDDGKWIAIQCKSRRLDTSGVGGPVTSDEINKFLAASANAEIWAERWLVVNGSVSLGGHADGKAVMAGAELKVVNLATAVDTQRAALIASAIDEACPHCEALRSAPTPPPLVLWKIQVYKPRRDPVCNARRFRWPWSVCVPMN